MAVSVRGGLPARLRDSTRARYLAAGSLVVVSAMSVPVVGGVFSSGHKVLAAASDLPAGHVLERSDLRLVRADAPTSSVVPGSELLQVVGKTLRVEVPNNGLLAAGDVGVFPPAGMAEVAFKVTPGQFPPALSAGQRVAVMPPAASQDQVQAVSAVAGSAGASAAPVVGQVLSIAPDPDANDGASVVALLVPAASASAVTAAQGGSLVGLDANGDVS